MKCRSVFLSFAGVLFMAGAFGVDFPSAQFPTPPESESEFPAVQFPQPTEPPVADMGAVPFPKVQSEESLLTATPFPKTFEDLSFNARLEFYREDYLPYAVEYDEKGVCIANCAYHGITISEDMQAVDDATNEMADLISEYEDEEYEEDNEDTGTTSGGGYHPPIDAGGTGVAKNWCQNGKSTKLPLRYPVDMTNFKYKIISDFGFRPRSANGARFHPAIDIACPVGTPVYATADGVAKVREQWTNGGAGRYITIKHASGLETQYLHLDRILIQDGQQVKACDKIALSGKSGNDIHGNPYTGPHLDYRIFFTSARNKFVDMLCPCKVATKSNNSSNNELNMDCVHSLFNAPYKFTKYNPNSDDTKRSLWRVEHGHCMTKNTDLLPDEVAP